MSCPSKPKDSFADSGSTTIIERATKIRRTALLPALSAPRYDNAWGKFIEWKRNQVGELCEPNEEMLLVYLDDLSDQFAANSLWTIYSMLKRQMLVSFFI
jgi:hypothetical protein